MKAELLEGEFAARGVPDRGGHLRLRSPDAIQLVSRAAEEGVPIVAVVGVDAATRAAPPAQRADFSAAVAEGHGCWDAAEAFIRARGAPGTVFEFTLGTDPLELV